MNNTTAARRLSRRSLLVRGGLLATTLSLMPILAAPTSAATSPGQLGIDASLGGRRPFPASNPWNTDISNAPIDPHSASILAGIGLTRGLHPDFGTVWDGAPNGIPYVVVPGTQPRVPITFTAYGDESDPGPYPVPATAPIEGGPNGDGDRHVLVIDRDNWKLYELFRAFRDPNTTGWLADSGAVFNLNSNALRPAGWTSADAAGLPVFPGLVRYDEAAVSRSIPHALRFTVQHSRRAYVPPARHWASGSTDPTLAPMGMRVRLRAAFPIAGFPIAVQSILVALKTYGMFVADNGSNLFLSGAPDPRWSDDDLGTLRNVHGSDFDVIRMDGLVTG